MTSFRQPSQRAEARALYRTATAAACSDRQADAGAEPTLPAPPSLTERVRALYETSVVPVREIAAIAGVTERTIYKYAQKERWTPRVNRLARGAGGRFVAAAEAGKPHATGIKAVDPAAAEEAAERCVLAAERAGTAVAAAAAAAGARAARAKAESDAEARLRAFTLYAEAVVDLAKLQADEGASRRDRDLAGKLANRIIRVMDRTVASSA